MKRLALALSIVLVPVAVAAQSATTTIAATGGDIMITAIQHGSVQIEHAGKVIHVDPAEGDFLKAKQADLVLVTDIHGDHLNPNVIAKVRKAGAPRHRRGGIPQRSHVLTATRRVLAIKPQYSGSCEFRS